MSALGCQGAHSRREARLPDLGGRTAAGAVTGRPRPKDRHHPPEVDRAVHRHRRRRPGGRAGPAAPRAGPAQARPPPLSGLPPATGRTGYGRDRRPAAHNPTPNTTRTRWRQMPTTTQIALTQTKTSGARCQALFSSWLQPSYPRPRTWSPRQSAAPRSRPAFAIAPARGHRSSATEVIAKSKIEIAMAYTVWDSPGHLQAVKVQVDRMHCWSAARGFPDTEEVTSSNLVPPTRSRPQLERTSETGETKREPFGFVLARSGPWGTPWRERGLRLLRPDGALPQPGRAPALHGQLARRRFPRAGAKRMDRPHIRVIPEWFGAGPCRARSSTRPLSS